MGNSKKKVVIIGAGAAGVFSAVELEKQAPGQFEIVLLEKNNLLGGHAKSRVELDGEYVSVDCGAQFFSDTAQPDYVAMLKEEGLFTEELIIERSIGVTIWDADTDKMLFKIPTTMREIIAEALKDPLTWINFTMLLWKANELYLESGDAAWQKPLGEWLDEIPFLWTPEDAHEFKTKVARPLLYQFGLVPPDQLSELSAKFVIYYLVTSLPSEPGDGLFTIYNSAIGLDGFLLRLLDKYDISVTLNMEVFSIRQEEERYVISTTPLGNEFYADEIIFATDPLRVSRMLPEDGRFSPVRDLLHGMECINVPVRMQQGAPSYMPANRDDWSVSNILTKDSASTYMLSIWFGPVRVQPGARHFFKSWGSPYLDPMFAPNFAEDIHQLVSGTPDYVTRRDELDRKYQGENNIWYVGGWTVDYDCQNACLRSARGVVKALLSNFGTQIKAKTSPERTPHDVLPFLKRLEKEISASHADGRGAFAEARSRVGYALEELTD